MYIRLNLNNTQTFLKNLNIFEKFILKKGIIVGTRHSFELAWSLSVLNNIKSNYSRRALKTCIKNINKKILGLRPILHITIIDDYQQDIAAFESFLEKLENVRENLSLKQHILLGHSIFLNILCHDLYLYGVISNLDKPTPTKSNNGSGVSATTTASETKITSSTPEIKSSNKEPKTQAKPFSNKK